MRRILAARSDAHLTLAGELRVVVTAVQVAREPQGGENVVAIHLRYNIISTNTPGNNVILAGVE